jgi:hypothetical protein
MEELAGQRERMLRRMEELERLVHEYRSQSAFEGNGERPE